jgi:hypothetical protein
MKNWYNEGCNGMHLYCMNNNIPLITYKKRYITIKETTWGKTYKTEYGKDVK